MMLDTEPQRTSLQVAPLAIHKGRSDSFSDGSDERDQSHAQSTNPYSNSHITPPITPNGSQENLLAQPSPPPQAVFTNFLRAFYPFHPTYAMSDSTVTLPLNEGDVVLVHSIHTNGWADGTQLLTGARGWLPTNYCEAYNPEEMGNLLKALLNFWDLLRSTVTNDHDIFGNQEFMKGIIAGVRHLLERTNCLTRESFTIQRNEELRKGRKSLLSELSSLVKTAKRLQESLRIPQATDDVNNTIDEMILRAFKIVVKGGRFLDLFEEDKRQRAPAAVTVMDTVLEESVVPPTPPADSTTFETVHEVPENYSAEVNSAEAMTTQTTEVVQSHHTSATNRRLSNLRSHRVSHAASPTRGHRVSGSISHRVSLAGHSPLSQAQNLVTEQLNASHDTFLSQLGSFTGRLHLQSQSRPELAMAIKQSASSGAQLYSVVNAVCNYNAPGTDSLVHARTVMYDRIRDLVSSARDILAAVEPYADDVIMPQDNSRLIHAARDCVRAAGECVAKTKWVIEKIGDFEYEEEAVGLGIDLDLFDAVSESRPITPERASVAESRSSESTSTPVRSLHMSMDKPLPQVPVDSSPDMSSDSDSFSVPASRPTSVITDDASLASPVSSTRPSLPPLPKLTTSLLPDDPFHGSPTTETSHDSEYQNSFRSDTMTATSSGTSSTYLSRDSESSMVSQTSTRATTPDHSLGPRGQPSLSEMSTTSSTGHSEDVDVESKLLEKTYAHELMFNKEGQVTGGSLPALVERLTTHEATPDAMFVSTFYLTFRLFCTPTKLAEALIDRFDYVGEAPHMANPVRLRVYNVMKGWIESHWRDSADREALPIIQHFAETKMTAVIPSAGKRLLELTERVASTDGSLVPRLVSSMGKTNTSIQQYVPADTPLPPANLSKSQLNMLSNWKSGGNCPSILDFDPLEIARQLTLKQMNIFCSILPEELLGSQWMKKGGADSPNVKAMSGFSTDMSNLVADTILSHSDVKKRAATIKQWIKVANQCLELNNYDGLMAIIASLNSSIISRLRKTWDLVSVKRREMLKTLEAVVEPSNNHKQLRARLQGHVPPCLPFLGMFLTDLTFVDIGNPATKQLPGSDEQGLTVVNYDKHFRTAKIIGDLQRFQIPYRLTELPDLQEWIQNQVVRVKESDQGNVQVSYYRKSLLLEPRENALRTPVEAPAKEAQPAQRGDLFGWMMRDRQNSHPTLVTS